MHEVDPAMLEDDESHPIPFLDVLDVFGVRKDGGGDLVLIVASPLAADERSQHRLLRKIQRYLSFVNSEDFLKEAGKPCAGKVTIIVKLHRDSAPEIRALLDRCVGWVTENKATLKIKDI